jgi:hypothetical protein
MQVRAKVTFQSQYGLVRSGEVFSAEEHYANQLLKGGKVTREPDELREPLKVDRTQHFKDAPLKKDQPTPQPSASENQPDDGAERPSLLSRAGRRLRKPTSDTAEPDAE